MDLTKTYVYEGTEVKATGRTASRKVGTLQGVEKYLYLYEICPVDGSDWKKWVNPDHLYLVKDNLDKDK